MENNKIQRNTKNLRERLVKKPETDKAKHYKKSTGFVKSNQKREGCDFEEYQEKPKQKYQEQNFNGSISEINEEKPEMIVGEEKIILEKDMSEETLALAEKIYLPRSNTFEKEFPRLSRIFPRLSISKFGVSLLKFKLRLKRARKSHKNIEEKTEIGYYDKEEAKQKYKEKYKVDGLEKSSIGNKKEKEQEHLNYEKDDNEER